MAASLDTHIHTALMILTTVQLVQLAFFLLFLSLSLLSMFDDSRTRSGNGEERPRPSLFQQAGGVDGERRHNASLNNPDGSDSFKEEFRVQPNLLHWARPRYLYGLSVRGVLSTGIGRRAMIRAWATWQHLGGDIWPCYSTGMDGPGNDQPLHYAWEIAMPAIIR